MTDGALRPSDLEAPSPSTLVVVVGPTASGKSELALDLAERWGGEIVSADSVQIYRRFDVGSGKPSGAELARVAHHLVSEIDPASPIDAARFAELAEERIADVRARGKTPIVCGGTFLWVRALVHGLAGGAPADPEVRAAHRLLVEREGRAALHAKLAAVDPDAARRLAPNDALRVSRALEVFELTGTRQSEWHERHGFREKKHDARLLGVARAREEIDLRIRARVQTWLAGGWIEEVRELVAAGYDEARAMGSVGYKEVRRHVAGELPRDLLEDTIVRATRVFVRRQRTWLRDEPVTWIAPPRG